MIYIPYIFWSMATRSDIANMIYPEITKTIEEYEAQYPQRSEKVVSRFGPSPTGFLHIWGVFASFVEQKIAKQSDGIFFLRIEDTDQKRLVEGSIELIIKYYEIFGIEVDEGPFGPDHADVGNYGPYIQSKRKSIYETFVKSLIERGLAYPCWMSTEEIDKIRDIQMKSKITPGIYGNYSVWRNKTPDEIAAQLQVDQNYIIRFRSPADLTARVVFDDLVKEKVSMIDNFNDIVLIKADGLPTYHLAHVVDDHLMRTTHVIRGEEWLTSVPLHLQLFGAFGFTAPQYAHLAPILKLDNGNKRKLSKRHDPEADVGYLFEQGFSMQGIIEYLLTIIDSSFEAWQQANPDKNYRDYDIALERMNKSGALFDEVKLQSVNNNYLSRISTDDLYNQALNWAEQYRPSLAIIMKKDPEYTKAALGIERHTEKDPKRFTTFQDIETQLLFFYDDQREILSKEKPVLPDIFTPELITSFVNQYSSQLNLDLSLEDWFAQLKEIGKPLGFAATNGEFKEGGYIGKVWDLAMFLRVQLCCATRTPDLYSVMKVLWKDRVIERLRS